MLEESLSSFHSIDEAEEEEEEEFKEVKEENVSRKCNFFYHQSCFHIGRLLLASLLHQKEEVRQAKGKYFFLKKIFPRYTMCSSAKHFKDLGSTILWKLHWPVSSIFEMQKIIIPGLQRDDLRHHPAPRRPPPSRDWAILSHDSGHHRKDAGEEGVQGQG